MQVTPLRSYRCFFTPLDRDGLPVLSESGVQPFVQVKANDAEHAQRAAHHTVGCPISDVQRIEVAA